MVDPRAGALAPKLKSFGQDEKTTRAGPGRADLACLGKPGCIRSMPRQVVICAAFPKAKSYCLCFLYCHPHASIRNSAATSPLVCSS